MRELFLSQEFRDFVLDLNRKNQLFDKGIDANGVRLVSDFAKFGRVYADRTIIEKEAKNQPTDRVTLKDSGDFYRSFKLELTGNSDFLITADTIKNDNNLMEVWGEAILGLTKENIDLVIEKAREIIIPIIRQQLLNAA
jgi:ketol-acid reductoisomerase